MHSVQNDHVKLSEICVKEINLCFINQNINIFGAFKYLAKRVYACWLWSM